VNTGLTPATAIAMPSGTATVSMTVNTLTQAQATDITANPANYYFNVHSPVNPGGAVRGQLTRTQ
jgi:acyl dehydratase